ncbi:reverse transcriptase domain-containing protein, partial [Tanacetum coccineum]
MEVTIEGEDPNTLGPETSLSPYLYHSSQSSSVPFPSRLKKQKKDDEWEKFLSIFKHIHINLPLLEALNQMPKRAKVLKDLHSNKAKLESAASSFAYHTDEVVKQEQWNDTLDHDSNWINNEEEDEAKKMEEPPKAELKALPYHLEYAFLQGDDQLPVVISSFLSALEKNKVLKVLKSHKKAIAWGISDIKGIDPSFCWRVCNDYRKLNDVTRKDHFTLPFIDQMIERLAGHDYYCFLDGFLGYFQIPIALEDQEKMTFTCPYGTFSYPRMPFGLCNVPATFQRCMMVIFHELIEDIME